MKFGSVTPRNAAVDCRVELRFGYAGHRHNMFEMVAELIAVVEVELAYRIRCQAPGCSRAVHKAVHVIAADGRLLVYGSSCSADYFGFGKGNSPGPRYGTSKGRKLTNDERNMLVANTASLVARMEAEYVAEQALRKAVEDERMAEKVRQQAAIRAAIEEDRRAPMPHGWKGGWRQPMRGAAGTDPLSLYRAQQAADAARRAIRLLPDLALYSLSDVAAVMHSAKAVCIARGVTVDRPEFLQQCGLEALAILRANAAE